MRIKKLELLGFKSFKDRTVIHFDEGITGIVGPNGCGKSNIVDALVWVMGEMSAKHLRGSSMSDVIFAGAEGFAPLGMAEVSLVLENDGGPFPAKYMKHSEVMITRRLHRSGESEYLINKEPARLRDIHEIFMDTGAGSKGFSIIEQGRIGEIITAKPIDRRSLIEEAAGITKFKVRKRESQRKLKTTEQNLLRLSDILAEQKRQLESLQRQAQRAERYKKIRDELEDKELYMFSQQYNELHEQTLGSQKAYDEAKGIEISRTAELSTVEAVQMRLKSELAGVETAVTDSQLKHKDLERSVIEQENKLREIKFECEQAKRTQEMTGSLAEKYEIKKTALEQDHSAIKENYETINSDLEELALNFEEKNTKYEQCVHTINTADERLTEKRREQLTLTQSESHVVAKMATVENSEKDNIERLEAQEVILEELEKKHEEFSKRKSSLEKDLEREKQLKLEFNKDTETIEANFFGVETKLQTSEIDLMSIKSELNEVASRLYGLENLQNNFEGYAEGVQKIMQWKGTDSQIKPLSEVVDVPEDYESAFEAALGDRLQLLLAKNKSECLEALNYLKTQEKGRSSFLINGMTSVRSNGHNNFDGMPGIKGLLNNLVNAHSEYAEVISGLLSNIVVVDTLDSAVACFEANNNFSYVSLEGDVVSKEGVVTGGAKRSADSGLLKRRREIKELQVKKSQQDQTLAVAEMGFKQLKAQFASLKTDLEDSRKKQSEKEVYMAELSKDYEQSKNELNNAERALENQKNEVLKINERLTVLKADKEICTTKINEYKTSMETNSSEVDKLTQDLAEAKEGVGGLQEEVSQLRADKAAKEQEISGLQSQLGMLQASLDEVTEQLSQMKEKTQESSATLTEGEALIEHAQAELESKISMVKESQRTLESVQNQYEVESKELREAEEKISEFRTVLHEASKIMGETHINLEQFKMKEQYLTDQVQERYMKSLAEHAQGLEVRDVETAQLETDVDSLKSKLKRIGEVNLTALKDYDDLTERFEFLNQQYSDLIDSKEMLKKVIDRVNRICSRRFKETFEQVNERFTKVFPVLFGGGEARLVLVVNEEKGETGIDIIAQPPGKKAANVSLLSGGEKALTAVSLIFSIFLVKPSPFCLLDEVDAPLDDANVMRFNDLVKEMAKRSQIIIVTHNKNTMRVNNKLYGVTQENKGVSKMVSVSFDQAEQVAHI